MRLSRLHLWCYLREQFFDFGQPTKSLPTNGLIQKMIIRHSTVIPKLADGSHEAIVCRRCGA
jgi:hypothetical protein